MLLLCCRAVLLFCRYVNALMLCCFVVWCVAVLLLWCVIVVASCYCFFFAGEGVLLCCADAAL